MMTKTPTTMMTATSAIETEIIDTAIERYNCLAAEIIRQLVPERGTIDGESGDMKLAGDFSLDNTEDTILLCHNGTNWVEVSRSDNGT